MAKFERSRKESSKGSFTKDRKGGRRSESRDRSGDREEGKERSGYEGRRKSSGGFGRDSRKGRGGFAGRKSDTRGYGSGARKVSMTKVKCSSCGESCEVPFKPTSNKPVYCDNCFSKKDKGSSDKSSNKNFIIINDKLDKIMKALDIK